MKTIRKILSLSLSILVLAAVLMLNPTFNSKVKAADNPVQLYYANYIQQGYYSGYVDGYIAIQNLAYTKNVVVHYSSGSTWKDVNATYYKTNSDGYEVWHFSTPSESVQTTSFAIRYDVNGQTYWDNNNGNNYTVSYYPNIGTGVLGKNALCADMVYPGVNPDGTKSFSTQIKLKNLGSPKVVTIRYTEDNWATYKEVNAEYSQATTDGSLEYWNASVSNIATTTNQVQFAVCYKVNGVEYWDNNFGSNYIVNYLY